MRKQYMDFVPTRKVNKPANKVQSSRVALENSKPRRIVERTEVSYRETVIRKQPSAVRFTNEKATPELGVIEDLNPELKRTNAPKRPLGPEGEIAKIKAKKIGNKAVLTDSNTVKTKASEKDNEDKKTFKTPKSPFINQEKVVKRPLSKNVYQKKVVPVKEEPKGPVAIIDKPAKDEKVGLVVTIILTIILGAAAGTVAFLLLPK